MKTKKVILISTAILLSVSGFIYMIYKMIPNYTFYQLSDLEDDEQKLIKDFYASGGTISKGKYFDIKYDYFNSYEDYSITIVKKAKQTMQHLNVSMLVKLKDGTSKILINNYPLTSAYQEFSWAWYHPHIWLGGSNKPILDIQRDGQEDSQKYITDHVTLIFSYLEGPGNGKKEEKFDIEAVNSI